MLDKLRIRAKQLRNLHPQDERFKIIVDILKQDDCFMKLSSNEVLNILKDLQIENENLRDVYIQILGETIK